MARSRRSDKYLEGLEAHLGERVRAERRRLGLKQAQLAERANVSDKWVSRVEGGENVSLHSLGALARALGVEPGDLLPTAKTRKDSALAREAASLIEAADRARTKKTLELMVKVLRAVNESS